MTINQLILLIILPYLFFTSLIGTESYNITEGYEFKLANLKNATKYQFYFQANYPKQLIFEFQIFSKNDEFFHELLTFYIKECESDLLCTEQKAFNYFRRNYMIIYLESKNEYYFNDRIPYYISNYKTQKILFEFMPALNLDYFIININLGKEYILSKDHPSNFTNIIKNNIYHFFLLDLKRFQRVNIEIISKSYHFWRDDFKKIYIKEFTNFTNDCNSYIYMNTTDYQLKRFDKVYKYNFAYDIKIGSVIAIYLSDIRDLDYLYFKVNIKGDNIIEFNNNHDLKNITYIESNLSYYLGTKISQFQTSIITFEYNNPNIPFENVDIYEYENITNLKFRIIQQQKYSFKNIDNDKLIMKFSYKKDNIKITNIYFRIDSKFYIRRISAKIDIINGPYLLNNGDNQTFENINSEYDLYYWIKISQLKQLNINLIFKYSEKSPINSIDIYEYYINNIFSPFYKYEKKPILIERTNNETLFTSLSYITEHPNIYYALLIIHPEKYLEYLNINVNINDIIYHLKNNISKNITNIKAKEKYYFFIDATIYNKLHTQLIISSENLD